MSLTRSEATKSPILFGMGLDVREAPLAFRLEELNDVARRIEQPDLRAAWAGDDVVNRQLDAACKPYKA